MFVRAPIMTAKLVSVIIPTYNQGRFIRTSALSALEQSYQPIELIVVDDGSTDNTRQQLAPYLDRIRYFSQPNAGPSAARNNGIRQARGDWVAFLDADDLWHRLKIERQLEAIRGRSDVALVGSPSIRVLPDALPPAPVARAVTVRDFLMSTRVSPSGALVRRQSFDTVGLFDESLRFSEDRDMWLRIAANFSCVLHDTPCWSYGRHAAQATRTLQSERMLCDYDHVLTKFFDAYPQYNKYRRLARSYLCFDIAVSYFDQGRRMTALGYLAQSAGYRPWGLGDPKRPPLARLRLVRRIVVDELWQLAQTS